MHSGIKTPDISDHFPIFLISKDVMLDSSDEPIHVTKREINLQAHRNEKNSGGDGGCEGWEFIKNVDRSIEIV